MPSYSPTCSNSIPLAHWKIKEKRVGLGKEKIHTERRKKNWRNFGNHGMQKGDEDGWADRQVIKKR